MMKNFILIIFVCLIAFLGQASASLSPINKSRIDSLMTVVENERGKKSIPDQISKYDKIVKAFGTVKYKDKDQKEMITYLVDLMQKNLNMLKSKINTQNDEIPNVDREIVENTWLSWHNDERTKYGLDPYEISPILNYSALIRAIQIAKEQRKTGSTHARKTGDGYRNTDSIKGRFSTLGINVGLFSESNAYGYYNCNKSDCTQDMISTLKKSFDNVLMDKQHHQAIVSQSFEKIGFGVSKNGKYIRVTTHYTD